MYLQITDLIFDLYGTLVDIHTDENETVWEKTALYFGFYGAAYTGSELKAAFERAMRRREAQAGQSYECFPDIPVEQVMAQLFRDQGITENADTLGVNAAQLFRIAAIRYIRLYPHVKQALDALRGMGYRLWLLTNAQHVFTAYELRYLGLADAFSGVYISSDYGCRTVFQCPADGAKPESGELPDDRKRPADGHRRGTGGRNGHAVSAYQSDPAGAGACAGHGRTHDAGRIGF